MAANELAKLSVTIEADNAKLRSGLKQAEDDVTQTAKRMDKATQDAGPFKALVRGGQAFLGAEALKGAVSGIGIAFKGLESAHAGLRGDMAGAAKAGEQLLDIAGRLPFGFGEVVTTTREIFRNLAGSAGAAEMLEEATKRTQQSAQRVADLQKEARLATSADPERQALIERQAEERAKIKEDLEAADALIAQAEQAEQSAAAGRMTFAPESLRRRRIAAGKPFRDEARTIRRNAEARANALNAALEAQAEKLNRQQEQEELKRFNEQELARARNRLTEARRSGRGINRAEARVTQLEAERAAIGLDPDSPEARALERARDLEMGQGRFPDMPREREGIPEPPPLSDDPRDRVLTAPNFKGGRSEATEELKKHTTKFDQLIEAVERRAFATAG